MRTCLLLIITFFLYGCSKPDITIGMPVSDLKGIVDWKVSDKENGAVFEYGYVIVVTENEKVSLIMSTAQSSDTEVPFTFYGINGTSSSYLNDAIDTGRSQISDKAESPLYSYKNAWLYHYYTTPDSTGYMNTILIKDHPFYVVDSGFIFINEPFHLNDFAAGIHETLGCSMRYSEFESGEVGSTEAVQYKIMDNISNADLKKAWVIIDRLERFEYSDDHCRESLSDLLNFDGGDNDLNDYKWRREMVGSGF